MSNFDATITIAEFLSNNPMDEQALHALGAGRKDADGNALGAVSLSDKQAKHLAANKSLHALTVGQFQSLMKEPRALSYLLKWIGTFTRSARAGGGASRRIDPKEVIQDVASALGAGSATKHEILEAMKDLGMDWSDSAINQAIKTMEALGSFDAPFGLSVASDPKHTGVGKAANIYKLLNPKDAKAKAKVKEEEEEEEEEVEVEAKEDDDAVWSEVPDEGHTSIAELVKVTSLPRARVQASVDRLVTKGDLLQDGRKIMAG